MTFVDAIRLWSIEASREVATAAVPTVSAAARTDSPVTPNLEQHVGTIYRYALRLTGRADEAEELTQETLLRGWRSRHKLRDVGVARVWLLRIATNLWTDHLRRAKFRPRVLETEPPCTRQLPDDALTESEQVRLALATMDELPPRQRQVLYLVTCEQLSHAEIANVLGIDTAAVKSNLWLARKEMRRRLKDVYESICGRQSKEEQ